MPFFLRERRIQVQHEGVGVSAQAGFAAGPATMDQIESGEAGRNPLGAGAGAGGFRASDRAQGWRRAASIDPSAGWADYGYHTETPLDLNKAQVMLFAGRKRPPDGWPPGQYQARYSVTKESRVVLEQTLYCSSEHHLAATKTGSVSV
jgi:hypothetical protein